MNDFLDRLAVRALGSETTLAPRLPSLFESSRHLPRMPAGERDVAPPHHRAAPTEAATAAVAVPASAVQTAAVPALERSRVAPPERVAVSPPPAPLATNSLRKISLPPSTGPGQPPAIEPLDTPARKPKADSPAPVQPRQTRVAPDRPEAASPAVTGSLLPSPTPVFATLAPAASTPALPGHATPRSRFAARGDSRGEAARDPVVQVSIGRLEVRATAAPIAAPRRHDGPRPSSLDDYLRQRGDKGAP